MKLYAIFSQGHDHPTAIQSAHNEEEAIAVYLEEQDIPGTIEDRTHFPSMVKYWVSELATPRGFSTSADGSIS